MEPTCRVCLHEKDLMVNIYEEVEDLQPNLSTLLEQCGNMKLDKHDKYPKYLCEECTSELLIAAKFREKCAHTQSILEEIEAELQLAVDVATTTSEQDQAQEIEEASERTDVVSENDLMDKIDAVKSCDPCEKSISCEQYFHTIGKGEYIIHEPMEASDVDSSDLIVLEYGDEAVMSVQECEVSHTETVGEEAGVVDEVLSSERFDPIESIAIGRKNVAVGFVCDCCGAFFQQAANLRRHMERVHVGLELFTCVTCRFCFSNGNACEEHSQTCSGLDDAELKRIGEASGIRKTSEVAKHECPYCGKQMHSRYGLEMHLRTHTGERPFVCEECGKSYKTQSALQAHTKRHLGPGEYICKVCQKAFYDSSNLKVHMRTHTKERPHTCNVCGKCFSRVFLLELHTRTHTGEKPYTCTKCNRAFAQLCDLKNHVLTHTGERRFKCSMCPKAFIKRQPMLLHMSKHSLVDPIVITGEVRPVAEMDSRSAIECGEDAEETLQETLDDSFDMSELIVTNSTKRPLMGQKKDSFKLTTT